ncbi:MAG: OmpA family protein [Pseudomonadales bacterium]|nr:OmpA family protein [Pseudomonadales bacterium]
MNKKRFFSVIIPSLLLGACMTYDPYSGEKKVSSATKGAAIGAGIAALGAFAANKDDSARTRNERILKTATAGAAIGGGAGYYMDRQEAKLRHQLMNTGVQVERVGDELILVMPSNITFSVNSSNIRPDFGDVLQSVALTLKEFDKTQIQVSGHTDSSGSDSYNMMLSKQRAQSVANVLSSNSVSTQRLIIQGFGETQPIVTNNSAAGKASNRRVELKLVPTG